MLKAQLDFLNTEEENPFVAEQKHIQEACPPDLPLDVCEEEDEDVDILD